MEFGLDVWHIWECGIDLSNPLDEVLSRFAVLQTVVFSFLRPVSDNEQCRGLRKYFPLVSGKMVLEI